jgi:hypothetical protein
MTVTPANALSVTEVLLVAPLFRDGVTTAPFDGSAVSILKDSVATLDVEPDGCQRDPPIPPPPTQFHALEVAWSMQYAILPQIATTGSVTGRVWDLAYIDGTSSSTATLTTGSTAGTIPIKSNAENVQKAW